MSAPTMSPVDALTEREIEVLAAFVDCAGTDGAACALGLAEGTVKNHLANARAKVGAQTTTQLAVLAAPRLRAHRRARRVGRKER